MPGDNAGNTLSTARTINAALGSQTFSDRVDNLDPNDYYRFTLSNPGSVSLALHSLSSDATLQLLNSSGTTLQSSTNAAAVAELINTSLSAGTYYIRVAPATSNSNTDYALNFNAQSSSVKLNLLWRDYANGANSLWFMSGASNTASIGSATILSVSTNWQIEAVADFNKDGAFDLLWRDYSSGANAIWFMGGTNNNSLVSTAAINSISTNWRIEGVADFNSDGSFDIVWRDYSGGANAVWFMGGASNTSFVSAAAINSISTNWQIEAVADFNKDGAFDLLWRDYSGGANAVWFMGGASNTSFVSAAAVAATPTSWQATPITRYGQTPQIDTAGNTLPTAFDIGRLSDNATYQEFVAPTDADDYYRFTLDGRSNFNLTLNGLAGDADVQLLNANGAILQSSTANGTSAEAIAATLEAGTYFVRVYPYSGATPYRLNLSVIAIAPPPIVTLTAPDASAAETGIGQTPNPGQFLITRTGDVSTALTVNLTRSGTATNGVDYSALPNSIVIPVGQSSVAIPVSILDDALIEGNETVVLSLAAGSGYTIGTNFIGTIAIADNDTFPDGAGNTLSAARDIGVLSSQQSFSDRVDASDTNDYYRFSLTNSANFSLALGGLAADADVSLLDSNGNEITGSYQGSNAPEIINRLLTAGTYYIRVFPYNQAATNYNLTLSAAQVVPPTVTLTTTDANAAEVASGQTPNPGQFTITRTGSTSTALTVNYSLSGTATNGTDYSQTGGSVVIPVGQTSVTVPINVINDTSVEGNETVMLTLNSNSAYTLGSTTTGTVTIADNDFALSTVAIAASDAQAAETRTGETPNPGQFIITRTGGNLNSALTVSYTLSGGATNGIDYSQLGSSVVIPIGQTSVTVPIAVIDDTQLEGNETVVLTLNSSSTYTLGTNTATATIADDALENVGNSRFSARDIGVLSTQQTFNDRVDNFDRDDYYRFTLNNRSNFNLTLNGLTADADVYLLNDRGATIDFSDNSGSSAESIVRELAAGTYYIRVYPYNSSASGGTNYTLRVSAATISALPSVSIFNSDSIAAETAATLPANPGQFIITRAGNTDTALTVNYTIGGTAINGSDYSQIGNSIIIPVGQTSATIPITVLNDSLTESNETVTLVLNSSSAYSLGTTTSRTVTIQDNDSQNGSDNTLTTARNIGVLSSLQTFSDRVDASDSTDNYVFTLAQASTVNLSLSSLTNDADLYLVLDANQNSIADSSFYGVNEYISGSERSGAQAESITLQLAAGTYHVQVAQAAGSTNYTLAASATPLTLPAPYHYAYGYGLVDAAAAVAQALGQAPFAPVADLAGDGWGLNLINAPEVWARGYTGQGVVVAVVDSGVNQLNHPDLKNNIWVNSREIEGNGIDDDDNGFIDDLRGWDFIDNDNTSFDNDGHGTHVAGIIGGENNGFGVTGVAYNAKIMPVRVLGNSGYGTWSQIAAGIRYAANNGADVINLSLGGSEFDAELEAAVRYAFDRGAVVVMATGNEYSLQPGYPADFANQFGIAVGAVDYTKTVVDFSNRSVSPRNLIVAPGVDVFSTYPIGAFETLSGTSMATPMVAGAAALLLSAKPTLTPAEVISLLTRTANPNGIKTA